MQFHTNKSRNMWEKKHCDFVTLRVCLDKLCRRERAKLVKTWLFPLPFLHQSLSRHGIFLLQPLELGITTPINRQIFYSSQLHRAFYLLFCVLEFWLSTSGLFAADSSSVFLLFITSHRLSISSFILSLTRLVSACPALGLWFSLLSCVANSVTEFLVLGPWDPSGKPTATGFFFWFAPERSSDIKTSV